MTLNRTHKSYLRGAIWLAALAVMVTLPGFHGIEARAQPVAAASR